MHAFQPDSLPAAQRPRLTPAARSRAPLTWPSASKSLDAERNWQIGLGLLFAAAILIRARYFGNPFMEVDEQFYLLVGDRLLHGSVPYVDIWDRKPPGLFLLYAAIRLLGGDGIVQYQIVAAIFAAGTAVMIALIARRISTPGTALVAALAYIPALAMNGGAGGQSPVFYNLPMAVAAWLLVRLATGGATALSVRRHGGLAMLLVGVAMQIKYSAMFEGIYFGLALAALSWRMSRRIETVVADILVWIAIAAAPTLLALAWYFHLGEGDAFLYANFLSIFERSADPLDATAHNLRHAVPRLALFLVPILVSEWLLRDHRAAWLQVDGGKAAHRFVIGWVIAALIGYAAFGGFYDHYALPLLVPLTIASAPAFAIAQRHIGTTLVGLMLGVLFVSYPIDAARQERHHGNATDAQIMVTAIQAYAHGGCPYIFYGEPILYHLTGACLPTRWAFPFHLNLRREAPALGVDSLVEVRRIMDSRPPVVVDRQSEDGDVNFAVQRFVRARLARDYRLVFTHPNAARNPDIDQLWALKR
jgi:4-amino-4-deoxy-L-arabinose transferase-like glycosyltransferase